MATHQHLGMILDFEISYENHLQSVNNKVTKHWSLEKTSTYFSEKISSDNLKIIYFEDKSKLFQNCFLSCIFNGVEQN